MKKLRNANKPLTRTEMRSVKGGLLPCGFGGYVCPPGCNDQYQDQFKCVNSQCVLTLCPLV